jgi:tRNA-(ms[2]io[6]A)-hydroxylase
VRELLALARRAPDVYLLDRLLIAGIIEARGCERFQLLAAALTPDLAPFYADFAASEGRHAELFIRLAEEYYTPQEVAERLEPLQRAETEIMRALPLRPALH